MRVCPVPVPGSRWANGYLVVSGGECLAVDPDLTGGVLEALLTREGLALRGILLTHGHFDHITGLAGLRERWPGVPIMIHELDAAMLPDPRGNLSALTGSAFAAPAADRLLAHGDRIPLGEEELTVLHTPGHTPGSVCYLAGRELLAGDTLFEGSVGRWDLPGGDGEALLASIAGRILPLEDDITVWPGHGPATTVGRERRGNPFLGGRG